MSVKTKWEQWQSRSWILVLFVELVATIWVFQDGLEPEKWIEMNIIIVPAFLALNSVEKWKAQAS